MIEGAEERFLHRLEAFSDIVIGFSLAQVGWALMIPANPAAIYTNPIGLLTFVMTFAIVASIWYSHNRLFADYFVPSGLPVLFNFILLAFVVLLVYMLQVFMHFSQGVADPTAFVGYLACLVVVYGMLALLFALGLRARWEALATDKRRFGILSAMRMGAISAGLVVGCAVAYAAHWPLIYAVIAIAPFALLARLAAARVNARIA